MVFDNICLEKLLDWRKIIQSLIFGLVFFVLVYIFTKKEV